MTVPLINKAEKIIFLVTGENKSKILKAVLNKNETHNAYPAQLIQPLNGELYWFVDDKANR